MLILDVEARALAYSTTKVRELVRLFIPLPWHLNLQRVRRCAGIGPQVYGLDLLLRRCQSKFLTCDNYNTSIILIRLRGDVNTIPASSVYRIPHTARRTISNVPSSLGLPSLAFSASSRYTKPETTSWSSTNRYRTTIMTAAKNISNNSDDSTHPWRRPSQTLNHAKNSQPFSCTRARIPLWIMRMTSITIGGTPKREIFSIVAHNRQSHIRLPD